MIIYIVPLDMNFVKWQIHAVRRSNNAPRPLSRIRVNQIQAIDHFNSLKPEFTIVIFIHYKPRIAVAILDLKWMKIIWCGLKIKKNYHVLVNQFHRNFHAKTLGCRTIKSVFSDVKWCFNASWGLRGLKLTTWLLHTIVRDVRNQVVFHGCKIMLWKAIPACVPED